VTIDPNNFVQGVDNPYFPLVPGTTLTYEGSSPEGVEHFEDYVTHDTEQVMGVTCIVVHNKVTLNGQPSEETFDWYAQDRDGNVWYFGETTKEFEADGTVSTAGSWKGGVDGALPGIIMPAHPQVGDTYRQEYYAGEAEDMAEILSLTETVTVPYGSFDNVLSTRDWTPLDLRSPSAITPRSRAGREVVQGGSGTVELVSVQRNEAAFRQPARNVTAPTTNRLRRYGALSRRRRLKPSRHRPVGGSSGGRIDFPEEPSV
jgi:hypothetical protein